MNQLVSRPTNALSGSLFAMVFFFVAGLSPTAWGDEGEVQDKLKQLSLEELMQVEVPTVYGASKHVQKTSEAPSSVSVVEQTEIKQFGYRTLADILRGVRGMYVSYDRNYGYIGVRGFNRPGDFGGRVLVLVDGQRLNEPIFDSAFNVTDFILDVDLIDRVEVIRGPGSSLYGNNGFFAVINVITRKGGGINGAEVSGELMSYDTYKGRITYGKQFTNGVEMVLSGTYFDSAGPERLYFQEFDSPSSNNGIAERMDRDQFQSGFGRFSWRDFTLEGAYVERDKRVPTGSFQTTFNDPRYHTIDTRSYVFLNFAHQFEDETLVSARISYDDYHYDADYPYSPVLNRDEVFSEGWQIEAQASRPLGEKNRLTIGAEYRDDFRLAQRNLDIDPFVVYLDTRRATDRYAIFAQDEFSILTNLVLNAGIRYDSFSTFGETWNPRVALIYSPVVGTTFKMLYGEAFRAPNAAELFYENAQQKSNPSLQPETIRSYEFVYEQRLPWRVQFTASAYYNEINNLIAQQTDPLDGLIYYGNVDQVEAEGLEFELERRSASGFLARASYALQHAELMPSGDGLSNSPQHLAKLNLIAPLWPEKVFAGLEWQYSSSVGTLAGNRARDFWIVNATLFSMKLLKNLEASVSVYNVFDRHYAYPGAEEHLQDVIYQDGRNFRLKLTYRF
jgi:outer membrane receptor for ferrienterochelin and colicins